MTNDNGNGNMATQTGNTYISERMIDIIEISAENSFRPWGGRTNCSYATATTTDNGNSRQKAKMGAYL